MDENKINNLQKELEASARRMKEYRDSGNYEQEAQEHENYNRILSEINDLQRASEKAKNEPKKDLQKELEASARRMREYRDSGNYEQEAQEHENYNRILSEINDLQRASEKNKSNGNSIKIEEKQSNLKWHPKLTQEQIEELIAEGIQPGDNEYVQALWNYGINPNEQQQNKAKSFKWHPKLTQEQIEELMAEGIQPGDNEYTHALWNYGINPNEDLDQQKNGVNKEKITRKDSQDLSKAKPQDQTKPEPQGQTKPEPQGQTKPEPQDKTIPTGDTNNKLPIRSFWEIYDSTCTQHCGTIPRMIHKIAKAPLFQMKGEDTLQKVLSFVPNVLTFIPKIIAKPINKALGTDKKYEEMYRNIAELSPEEFAVLVESSKDTSNKDFGDKDYLSPTFMKQNKVNDLYLDAVFAIYKQKQREKIDFYNREINDASKRIKELISKGADLTDADLIQLSALGHVKDEMEQLGDEEAHKTKLFETGAKEKTSSYRNISGWILGKYNPDNREFNHKMAALAKERREALAMGSKAEATIITQQMDDLAQSETRILQVGKRNTANRIDRGNTSIEEGSPCELLDKGQSTKTRLLLTNLAVGTAIMKTLQTVRNNQIIANQRQEIADVNKQNADLSQKGVESPISKDMVTEAEKEYANKNVAAAHATGEYANLDARAMENGGSWTRGLNSQEYRVSDDALHSATASVSNQVKDASPLDAARISSEYYNKVASPALEAAKNYAPSHDFDYSGYIDSLGKSIGSDAVVKLFEGLENAGKQTIDFVAVRDYLKGISNSADYALLALIGASVAKTDLDKNLGRPGYVPQEKSDKKSDKEENFEVKIEPQGMKLESEEKNDERV